MVTSNNPFRHLPAQFPPGCVKPPRNAESIASSAFLARQKFCSESVQNRFLEATIIKFFKKDSSSFLFEEFLINK